MIKLSDSEIAQIMPPLFKNAPEVLAISYSIAKQIKRIHTNVQKSMVYASVDSLPGEILDLMAIELRTQYYAEKLPIEQKRELIKNTLAWYMKAGTKGAVEELVKAVFTEGKVTEWFEYTQGEKIPGTFDVDTSVQLTPDIIQEFGKLIQNVKNTRSHIRAIGTRREIAENKWFGCRAVLDNKVIIVEEGYSGKI